MTAHLASGERVTGSLLIGADGLWSNIRKQVIGRRAAACFRPHHLSLGHSDRGDARGPALERGDAVGRPEMPHRSLSAVGLEGVQPRRHLSQRRAGAGRGKAGFRTGGHAAVSPTCMRGRKTSFATARTGSSGCCATAIPTSAGSMAASRCSVMPRIRCCSISRKAPARRWKTRFACRTCSAPIPTITTRRWNAIGAQRFPRTARVQLLSRAIGEHIYHPSGEHARIRNAIMSAKSSEDYYGDLAWLYGGTGLEG